MKIGDLFTSVTEREAARRRVERLYRAYVAAGWQPDDARRCADRDEAAGLYRYAFGPDEEVPQPRAHSPPV